MKICKFCGRELGKFDSHQSKCKNNPDRKMGKPHSEETKLKISQGVKTTFSENPSILEKISLSSKERSHSPESKMKISNAMKIAHSEGRAWNIGNSRHNNEPSYPEKFFIKVIDNHFINKNYVMEFPIGRYAFDFAWPELKLAIEIDGEQHERFDEYKQRDIKKDSFALNEGWKVLRIRWIDLFNNTAQFIKIAYDFIHTNEI